MNVKDMKIYENGLCMNCGTCEGICPSNAIKLVIDEKKGLYKSIVNDKKCTYCGLCVDCCPGRGVDFKLLNDFLFDKQPKNFWIGNYNGIYIGHASDMDIRFNSSSGGLITALLIFALEKGLINGAVVTRMKKEKPFEPEVFIARNREEILLAAGSKYCPVPTNSILKILFSLEGKYAVVGLPCHIHGIRMVQTRKKILREKIPFCLGLMCSNNATFIGTKYYFQQWGININEVRTFLFREPGWIKNYNFRIIMKNGTKIVIPRSGESTYRMRKLSKKILHNSVYHYDFVIPRCLTCCDHTAILSDISFGDPRLPDLIKTETIGKSLIVSRTERGKELLELAKDNSFIEITEEIGVEKFFMAQNVKFKKQFYSRARILKFFRKKIPNYYFDKDYGFIRNRYLNILLYLPSYFTHHRWSWPFLPFFRLIRYYVLKISALSKAFYRKLQKWSKV